jgi:O-antigen ligase
MNRMLAIWIEKMNILGLCLILAVITLPFDNNLNSYTIVAFGVTAFFSNGMRRKIILLKYNSRWWLLPMAYFFWTVTFFFIDKSPNKTTKILDGYSSLIAFPILLGSIEKLKARTVKNILISFVLSNVAGSFYCVYKAFLEYKAANNYVNLFFYHHLSEHIGISAIYFSMYCVFSIMILLYYYYFIDSSWRAKFFAFLAMGWLVFFVIILSSKMFIFLLYLSGLLIGFYFRHYFRNRKWGFGSTLALFVVIPFLLYNLPYTKDRIKSTRFSEYRGVIDNNNGLAVRGLLWKSSWDLIKHNSILGMGHYEAQDSLREKYQHTGFEEGVTGNYNSHNQYLYTLLCYGWPGLLMMVIFLIRFFWISVQRKFFLSVMLGLFFIIANITECMLETQKGIVFFMLFSCLLLYHAEPEGLPSHQKDKNQIS